MATSQPPLPPPSSLPTPAPAPTRIDVHHHIFPPAHIYGYAKDALNARAGWRTPAANVPWAPAVSLRAMDAMGVQAAVLSYPAGVPARARAAGVGDGGKEDGKQEAEERGENRRAARALNEYARSVCEEGEGRGRFGWMACLPDWRDTAGALDELAYALDVLQADGVSVSSSYGEGADAVYIGDDMFDPIWAELDRRGATVFLHGAQTPSSTPYPHAFLGLPITEVPNETFKAAAHLVVTGKKRRLTRTRVVLAHLGGSAPCLAPRVAVLAAHMGCALAPEACLADFASFYFDAALAAHESTLGALGALGVGPERVVFGTDFPGGWAVRRVCRFAVSTDMAGWYTKNVDAFYADDPAALAAVQRENALRLFPRLRERLQQRAQVQG
ncbi:hypothetical protein EIP86_000415 [Pleurotus ostreatoroseus]|nr:hypothetical protein EIP86_000415 [Pleurotus ostreatoroseus]